MILIASFSSLTAPMCQPPRAMIDTRTPVLPSGRVGSPLEAASSAPSAPAARVSAAPAASEACRNSRRLLGASLTTCLLHKAESSRSENSPLKDYCLLTRRGWQPIPGESLSYKLLSPDSGRGVGVRG